MWKGSWPLPQIMAKMSFQFYQRERFKSVSEWKWTMKIGWGTIKNWALNVMVSKHHSGMWKFSSSSVSDLHSDFGKSFYLSRLWGPHLQTEDLGVTHCFSDYILLSPRSSMGSWALEAWGGGWNREGEAGLWALTLLQREQFPLDSFSVFGFM